MNHYLYQRNLTTPEFLFYSDATIRPCNVLIGNHVTIVTILAFYYTNYFRATALHPTTTRCLIQQTKGFGSSNYTY